MALRDARSIGFKIHPPAPGLPAPLSAEVCYSPETRPISSRGTSPSRIPRVPPFATDQAQTVSTVTRLRCANINSSESSCCSRSEVEPLEQTVMRPSMADRSSISGQSVGTMRGSIDNGRCLRSATENTMQCAAYGYTQRSHVCVVDAVQNEVNVCMDCQKKDACKEIGFLRVPGTWRGTLDRHENKEVQTSMSEACRQLLQPDRVQHDIDIMRRSAESLSSPIDFVLESVSDHDPGTPDKVCGHLPASLEWLSSLYFYNESEAGCLLRRNGAVYSRDALSKDKPVS